MKIHETQSTEEFHNTQKDELYSPLENFQKIEGGGVYKRQTYNLKNQPKGIRYIGYFMIGFILTAGILGLILSFLK